MDNIEKAFRVRVRWNFAERKKERTLRSASAIPTLLVFAYSFSRFASSAFKSRNELEDTPAARALSRGAILTAERRS